MLCVVPIRVNARPVDVVRRGRNEAREHRTHLMNLSTSQKPALSAGSGPNTGQNIHTFSHAFYPFRVGVPVRRSIHTTRACYLACAVSPSQARITTLMLMKARPAHHGRIRSCALFISPLPPPRLPGRFHTLAPQGVHRHAARSSAHAHTHVIRCSVRGSERDRCHGDPSRVRVRLRPVGSKNQCQQARSS